MTKPQQSYHVRVGCHKLRIGREASSKKGKKQDTNKIDHINVNMQIKKQKDKIIFTVI